MARGKNLPEALRWYERAAQQMHPRALKALGEMYEKGKGVEKNLVKAYACLSLASERGIPSLYLKSLERRMNSDQIAAARRLAREWQKSQNSQ